MAYGELYLPPVATGRNAKTGRFVKGSIPFYKGKKWGEYMGKRAQRRSMRGWKNLDLYRGRPSNPGRKRKKVAGITDEGKLYVFPSIAEAARSFGIVASNIRRCCKCNESGRKSNHRYMGIRWFFESGVEWLRIIAKS